MLSNEEILQRIKDRYTTEELIEELGWNSMHIHNFLKTFKTLVMKKQKDLDIW